MVSFIGVSGFLISCAICLAISRHAASFSARTRRSCASFSSWVMRLNALTSSPNSSPRPSGRATGRVRRLRHAARRIVQLLHRRGHATARGTTPRNNISTAVSRYAPSRIALSAAATRSNSRRFSSAGAASVSAFLRRTALRRCGTPRAGRPGPPKNSDAGVVAALIHRERDVRGRVDAPRQQTGVPNARAAGRGQLGAAINVQVRAVIAGKRAAPFAIGARAGFAQTASARGRAATAASRRSAPRSAGSRSRGCSTASKTTGGTAEQDQHQRDAVAEQEREPHPANEEQDEPGPCENAGRGADQQHLRERERTTPQQAAGEQHGRKAVLHLREHQARGLSTVRRVG